MHQITDIAELQQRRAAGQGYIYNDFTNGSSGHQNNLLHAASCPSLAPANLNVAKYFAPDIYSVLVWLLDNKGDNWKPCPVCQMHTQQSVLSQGEGVSSVTNSNQEPLLVNGEEEAPSVTTTQGVLHFNVDADPLNADWPKVVQYGEDEVLRRWGLTREEYELRYHGHAAQDA